MPLPLFKLGALLAKQISKPLSKILKDKAKQNATFKDYFIIPSANVYHYFDITLRMRVLGLGSPDKVPPLTEKAAIELGGDILAEFFVFGTACAAILIEYLRQSTNKSKQDEALVSKVQGLEENYANMSKQLEASDQRVTDMAKFVQEQKAKYDEMSAKLSKLEAKKSARTQSSQTTSGRQIGKIIVPKSSSQASAPNKDVTNSIVYQCAEKAAEDIKSFLNPAHEDDVASTAAPTVVTTPPSTTTTTPTTTIPLTTAKTAAKNK